MFGSTNRFHLLLICFILPVDGISKIIATSNSDYYDAQFVIKFAKQLVVKHRFETLITYATNRKSEMLPEHHLVNGCIERQIVQQLELPIIVWSLRRNATFWRIITHKTLVLATIDHYSTKLLPMLEVLQETLQRRHEVYILFIMKHQSPTRQQLQKFFTWCWNHNFVNVAVTFQTTKSLETNQVHNQLLTYTPFPTLRVINVTRFGVDYEWPIFTTLDVKGYEFRFPIFQDPPATYLMPDGQLRGVTGLLISSYIKHINGSWKFESLPNVDRGNYYNHTLLAAARNEIDFGAHLISTMDINANKTTVVHSYVLTNTCLMVPWKRDSVLRRFFRSTTWTSYCFLFIVALVTVGWWLYARQGAKGLYLGICIYYLQPLSTSSFKSLPRAYKIVHVSMMMSVLILRSMRSALMSASFSVQQLGPQIESIDDFLASPYHIMITETENKMYFDTGLLPAELKDRFVIVDRAVLLEHRENLNTSYAYLATKSYSNILKLRQRLLLRPPFRVVDGSQLCTPSYFLGIPIQYNSPFKKPFFQFYLQSLRYGFQRKWLARTNMYLFQTGNYTAPRDGDLPFAIIVLRDFDILFKVYGFAVLCAFLCLLIEILHKRFPLVWART
ncbi:hypothetical protein KR215_003042 [Drosophila sulfurigaster]|nr:hypothetical protein KR215_003042 [Drosophila sulfurigaster]